jgi:histidine triad (HIT) family protein
MASIFSRIVKGEIPCHKVWEDDRHLAFLDLRPVVPGHTLVIPKREIDYLFDLPAAEHAALWTAAHGVARRLKEKLGVARVCVTVIGFEVPHAHIHLLPANRMADIPWRGGSPANTDDLAALAAKLRV